MDLKFNLERDLHRSDNIADKVQNLSYARDLYAALCNNEWIPKDAMEILKNEGYNCSWRYAGGIVARLRGTGDYMDFYCSSLDDYATPEGVVTDEIMHDFNQLGWILKHEL
jgi:hypothetical protein